MGCLCGDDRQRSRQGLVSYEIIHVAALLPPENPTKVAQRQGIPNHHSGFNTTGMVICPRVSRASGPPVEYPPRRG